MSNLAARILTAVVAVPILILAILWHNPLAVWGIVFAATGVGLYEFYGMTLAAQPRSERLVAVALGLAFSAAVYWASTHPSAILVALAGVTLGAFLFYLMRYGDMATVAARVSATLAGIVYVGLLMTFLALLKKRGEDGGAWVLVTLTCTWFADTGAYFAGRFLGPLWPRKLYESVSPKKTVVGGIGGLVGSVLALVLAKLWYLPGLCWTDCVLVAVPANVLGQAGDLCESLLKRSVGVKDSGAILPGHGGLLDRVDAVLFAVPYVYAYARWIYCGCAG